MKLFDRIFGKPSVLPNRTFVMPNRKAKRTDMAMRMASAAAPARRKHEKRGAPGRSTKGRKPHRV